MPTTKVALAQTLAFQCLRQYGHYHCLQIYLTARPGADGSLCEVSMNTSIPDGHWLIATVQHRQPLEQLIARIHQALAHESIVTPEQPLA